MLSIYRRLLQAMQPKKWWSDSKCTSGIQTQKCQTKAFLYTYVLKRPKYYFSFVILKGTNVILEAKEDPPADRQKWKRSTPDNEGWFTLQNPNSERYLTAISAVDTIISGKE